MDGISLNTASFRLGASYTEATSGMTRGNRHAQGIQALRVHAISVFHHDARTLRGRNRGRIADCSGARGASADAFVSGAQQRNALGAPTAGAGAV